MAHDYSAPAIYVMKGVGTIMVHGYTMNVALQAALKLYRLDEVITCILLYKMYIQSLFCNKC